MAPAKKSPASKKRDIELAPDAWSRFERAIDVVAKSPPQHRAPKKKPAKKKKPASKVGRHDD
jgi:hypothetical protein